MQRLFIDRVPRDALYEHCAPARNWTAGLGCVTKEVEGPGYRRQYGGAGIRGLGRLRGVATLTWTLNTSTKKKAV